MRWIFLTLTLANVALFVWFSFESSRRDRLHALDTELQFSDAMPGDKLILVSELTAQQREDLNRIKPPTVSNPKPEIQEEPLAAEAVSSADENATALNTADSTDQPATAAIQCFVMGPGATAAQIEQISQRLMAVGVVSDSLELDAPSDKEYWVILPPFNDDKAALRKLQELQGRGITAQVILKGPLANAISFGLYGQKKEAEQQAQKIQQLGYRTEIRSLVGVRQETWVFLSERQSPKLTDAMWQDIQHDFPRMTKKPYRCR